MRSVGKDILTINCSTIWRFLSVLLLVITQKGESGIALA
ncbi:hypothetical protein JCM19241_2617 [Vibrio ishigakensis]|uniref:Uncharacterized protein n=1 Tax=Vibrio ishigakensis TaxID=1481914 RepID=A0A0B8Q885_9VIBR|nr:hypothetical protein JCM19241_2617 [Vibrio ishigakensis]